MANRGRPSFEVTDTMRSKVEAWAAVGVNQDDICKMIVSTGEKPIDKKTLRKHFAAELEIGMPKANANVAANLYKRATGSGRDAVNAAKFWLGCRAGWKQTDGLELSGPGGAAIQTETSTLSTDEKAARFALILAAAKKRKDEAESE